MKREKKTGGVRLSAKEGGTEIIIIIIKFVSYIYILCSLYYYAGSDQLPSQWTHFNSPSVLYMQPYTPFFSICSKCFPFHRVKGRSWTACAFRTFKRFSPQDTLIANEPEMKLTRNTFSFVFVFSLTVTIPAADDGRVILRFLAAVLSAYRADFPSAAAVMPLRVSFARLLLLLLLVVRLVVMISRGRWRRRRRRRTGWHLNQLILMFL